ncbi:MAG: hypothetical protein HQL70_03425 [Magnetococcales bacterium]|nr:hypothetical protein [Magnetococcales bacterium]
MARTNGFLLIVLFFINLFTVQQLAHAAPIAEKTSADVYRLTMVLAQHVYNYRKNIGIKDPWPDVPQQTGKKPHHVIQKAIEILEKINRLRINQNFGEISIPPHPARHITPDEVFNTVGRLLDEMKLLRELKGEQLEQSEQRDETGHIITGWTPNDVYQNLWTISLALDPVLGVRGFTPADVYAKSKHIINLVRFLRQTQNLPLKIKKPKRTTGKHPNHALQSTYKLLAKIAKAENNLWMLQATVPKIEKRVITPTEVYDALQNVIAELQRIKFRLSVERHFPIPEVEQGKTPDDVIQNLEWATLMMPTFPVTRHLRQQDPASLTKTPDDAFAATLHALDELKLYQTAQGIRSKNPEPPNVSKLQPKHVYQKTLSALHKVNQLRKQNGLGALSEPRYPLQPITSANVYELAVRLDFEMEIIYRHAGMTNTEYFISSENQTKFTEKTSSDVYKNVWRFSNLIDTILGTDSFSSEVIYQQTNQMFNELLTILKYLNHTHNCPVPAYKDGVTLEELILKNHAVLKLINRVQRRAGVRTQNPVMPAVPKNATANDVFNIINVLHAELISLKLFFGITETVADSKDFKDKSLGDAMQLLQLAEAHMLHLLEIEHSVDGEKS